MAYKVEINIGTHEHPIMVSSEYTLIGDFGMWEDNFLTFIKQLKSSKLYEQVGPINREEKNTRIRTLNTEGVEIPATRPIVQLPDGKKFDIPTREEEKLSSFDVPADKDAAIMQMGRQVSKQNTVFNKVVGEWFNNPYDSSNDVVGHKDEWFPDGK